jgi:hypothetical protein
MIDAIVAIDNRCCRCDRWSFGPMQPMFIAVDAIVNRWDLCDRLSFKSIQSMIAAIDGIIDDLCGRGGCCNNRWLLFRSIQNKIVQSIKYSMIVAIDAIYDRCVRCRQWYLRCIYILKAYDRCGRSDRCTLQSMQSILLAVNAIKDVCCGRRLATEIPW